MASNGYISDLKVRTEGKIVNLLTCFKKPLEDLEYSTTAQVMLTTLMVLFISDMDYELSLHGKQFLKKCLTKIITTNV